MPDQEKISVSDFAAKIKTKYPEYKDIDDSTLTSKMLEKYPEYKDTVNIEPDKKKEPTTLSPFGESLRSGLLQKPVSESTSTQIKEAPKKEQALETAKETRQTAIKNTLGVYSKTLQTDAAHPVAPNDPSLLRKQKELETNLKEGNLQIIKSPSTGQPILARKAGFLNSFGLAHDAVKEKELEDKYVSGLTDEQAINHFELKQKKETEYLPSAPSGIGGALGKLFGENANAIAEIAAYGTAAGKLAEAAGATGVAISNAEKFGSFLSFATKAGYSGYADNTERVYNSLRKQDPNGNKLDQIKKAKNAGLIAEGTNIAGAALMSGLLPSLKGATEKINLNGLGTSLENFAKHTAKEAGTMGGYSALTSVVSDLGAATQGEKFDIQQTAERAGEQFTNMAALTVLMSTGMGVLTGLANVPKYIEAQAAGAVSKLPREQVKGVYRAAEESDILPKGTTDKVMGKLEEHDLASSKVPSDLPEEHQAALTGIQVKINKLEKLKENLAEQFHPRIDNLIDQYKKRSETILNSDNFLKGEVDELTGNPALLEEKLQPTILRHAQTEYNTITGIKGEQLESEPLSQKGKADAKIKAADLIQQGIKNIVTSPLTRSRETADIIAKETGGEVTVLPELAEKSNDESTKQFAERVQSVHDKVKELDKDHAVITHGSVMGMMDALDKANGDIKESVKIYEEGAKRHGNLEEYKPITEEQRSKYEEKKSGISVLQPEEVKKPDIIEPIKTQYEATTIPVQTEVTGEQPTAVGEVSGETIQPKPITEETGTIPPITPERQAELESGDIEGTPIKMKLISDAREYFRKVGVSWDNRSESAMKSLADFSVRGGYENLYDAANAKVNEWYAKVQKGGFNANVEEVIQMGYYRHATERMMNEQSKRMDSSIEFEQLNAIGEFGKLQDNLDKVDAVIGGSGSEAGAAFGLRQGLFRTDSETSLNIAKGEVMSVVNPIVSEIIKAEYKKGDKANIDKINEAEGLKNQAIADVERIHSEEQRIEKEIEKQLDADATKRFEDRVKEEVTKRLKELKEKPQKGKLTVEQAKKTADKLRNIADNVENFLKAKGAEGAEQMGISLQKAVADAIRYIADRIEKGDIPDLVAQAIKRFSGEGVDETELKNNIHKALTDSGIEKEVLEGATTKEKTVERIKEIAKNENTETITTSMVQKGLINDLVNQYIDEGVEPKDVIDKVFNDLKSDLKGIERNDVRDAYMKEGKYQQQSKESLNKERTQKSNELKRLEDLTKKLEQLKQEGIAYEDKNNKVSQSIETESAKVKAELERELLKQGIKKETGSSEEKSEKETRAVSHNERVKDLSKKVVDMLNEDGISDAKKEVLNKVKETLNKAEISDQKIKSIQDKEQLMAQSIRNILGLLGDSKFKDAVRSEKLEKLKKELEGLTKQFEADKKKSEIKLNTDATTKRLQNEIDAIDRKIKLGEFDEKPKAQKVTSAKIIQLETAKRLKQKEYKKIQHKIQDQNKTWYEKAVEASGTLYLMDLISGWTTTAAVAFSGATKPLLETATRGTTGRIAPMLFKNLSYGAGAEGATERFIKQEQARYKAILGRLKPEQVKKNLESSVEKLGEANKEYQRHLEAASEMKSELGEDSKEYKEFVDKVLTPALNKSNNSMFDTFIPVIQSFFGADSFKDAAEIMLKGASQLEELMGYKTVESFKELSAYDKTVFLLGFMGRSHSVLKNFSARGEFAAGFMARMENRMKKGEDISQASSMLEVANEAMNDYNRGKYQQSNFLNEVFKSMKNGAEKLAEEHPNNKVWGTSSKALNALFKIDFPIAKTPLNILDEAVTEYMFGIVKGGISQLASEYKGAGGVKGLMEVAKGEKSLTELRQQISEHIKNMPPEYKDMILRAYRKGGFVAFLMAVGGLGWIHYGGARTKTSPQKKKEGEKGYEKLPINEQLDYGQLQIGDWKMNKEMSHIFTHSSILYPYLGIVDYLRMKDKELRAGKGEAYSSSKALMNSLSNVIEKIPYTKELNPLAGGFKAPTPVPLGRLTQEIQGEGRKPTDWWEGMELKIPGMAGNVGYAEGVKEIKNVNNWYNEKRKQARLKGKPQEVINKLDEKQEEYIKELKKAETKKEADDVIRKMKMNR